MRDSHRGREPRYQAANKLRRERPVFSRWMLWAGVLFVVSCGPGEGAPSVNLEAVSGGETTAAPVKDQPITAPAVPPAPAPAAGSCENKAAVYDGGYRCAKHLEARWLDYWIGYGILPEDWCQCLALYRSARLTCESYSSWGTDAQGVERAEADELSHCTPQGDDDGDDDEYSGNRWRNTYQKWFASEEKAGRCYPLADGSDSCDKKR